MDWYIDNFITCITTLLLKEPSLVYSSGDVLKNNITIFTPFWGIFGVCTKQDKHDIIGISPCYKGHN
jgi:hypothetical protein